jgi:hypothetical protein
MISILGRDSARTRASSSTGTRRRVDTNRIQRSDRPLTTRSHRRRQHVSHSSELGEHATLAVPCRSHGRNVSCPL